LRCPLHQDQKRGAGCGFASREAFNGKRYAAQGSKKM